MAPVLQCPDCRTKHPLDVASSASSFRCKGCGRVLKVPAEYVRAVPDAVPDVVAVREPAPAPAAAAAAVAAPMATQTVAAHAPVAPPVPVAPAPALAAVPTAAPPVAAVAATPPPTSTPGLPPSPRLTRAAAGAVPFSVRLVLWIIAVPMGFLVVFGIARALGLFTSTQLENVFLEDGWNRFWPVARLLPFVALVTAGIVQGGVEGVSRWRHRRAVARMTAAPRMPNQEPARKRARA